MFTIKNSVYVYSSEILFKLKIKSLILCLYILLGKLIIYDVVSLLFTVHLKILMSLSLPSDESVLVFFLFLINKSLWVNNKVTASKDKTERKIKREKKLSQSSIKFLTIFFIYYLLACYDSSITVYICMLTHYK